MDTSEGAYMQLGYYLISKTKDEHLREIAGIARSQGTLIFIDTNILAYLYKLNAAARREFFVWTDSLKANNRLRIPAWAANEYANVVTKKELHSYTPKSKDPDQTKKALEAMHEIAALFVDGAVLSEIQYSGDRANFLSEFKAAINNLSRFTRALKYQFSPENVHEEIQLHLNSTILDSNLAQLCNRAHTEGEARVSHRLPPAFRDEGKPENKYGDLIIWFEILQYSASQSTQFNKVLFVTNDEKSDWVYAPQCRKEVRGGNRVSTPNTKPEIKVANPRLASEFRQIVGHSEITICSLAALIEGLSKDSAENFAHLAAAIQLDLEYSPEQLDMSTPQPTITEAHPEITAGIDVEIGAVPTTTEIVVVQEETTKAASTLTHLIYDTEALNDSDYSHDAPSEINEIIRELRSHNWYTQNPAIEKIAHIRNEIYPPTSWFVLGRNIYQAACGNSRKAMDFMVSLDAQLANLTPQTQQHLLAGMLFEIYFDSSGIFRDELKNRFMDQPLHEIVKPKYANVQKFILQQLGSYKDKLTFLPGDTYIHVLRIVSTPLQAEPSPSPFPFAARRDCYELQSVQIDDIELMQENLNTKHPWPSTFTEDSIVSQISGDRGIPTWAIRSNFEPGVAPHAEFKEPQGRVLVTRS